MIILRFRDLTIPDGETIFRHNDIISSSGLVWWGWIKRKSEDFPFQLFVDTSQNLESAEQRLVLFHSGDCTFYGAKLKAISALPGGQRTRCPDLRLTPPYMRESVCPAWFCLTAIDPTPHPSLECLVSGDQGVDLDAFAAGKLSASGATLWRVGATNEDCA